MRITSAYAANLILNELKYNKISNKIAPSERIGSVR